MIQKWLCTISVKDWVHVSEGKDRVIEYIEIETLYPHQDEYNARHIAFDEFEKRSRHEPRLKKLMALYRVDMRDLCCPEAVEV